MLDIVRTGRTGRLRTYTGTRNYANIRLIRTLMSISSGTISDSSHCWSCLSAMSPHVRDIVRRRASSYEIIMRIRDHLRCVLSIPSYSLHDMVCFLCLIGKQ